MSNLIDEHIINQINNVADSIIQYSKEIPHPVIIAIDGGSGSGKSTVAEYLGRTLPASIVPLDDFFSMNIPDTDWDTFSTEEKLKNVFDWQRVIDSAIVPLRNNQPARWRTFDFLAGLQLDGMYPLAKEEKILNPTKVVLLEGAYSASPFLKDVIDKSILIDVPVEIRHKRLSERDDPDFSEQWHRRWDAVEAYYFKNVRPKLSFDWVIEE